MKNRSYIIGGIIALVVVIATCLIIFWPKAPTQPSSSQMEEDSGALVPESSEGDASPTQEGTQPLKSTTPTQGTDLKLKKIEAVFAHARVTDEFKAMDELLEAQLDHIQSTNLSKEEQEELEKLKKIVNSEALEAKLKQLVSERFDEQELESLNEIYQNPLVSKMKEDQVRNQTPEGQKEMMEYYKQYDESKIPAERMDLIKNYNKVSGNSARTLETIGKMGSLTGNEMEDPKKKAEILKTMGPAIEKANNIQQTQLFQNLSTDEIKNLTAFAGNPVFQKFEKAKQDVNNGTIEELTKTVKEGMERKQKENDHNK